MFQLGGEYWRQLFPTLLDVLAEAQHDDGSWDPESLKDGRFGNVYATALTVVALATPYRFFRSPTMSQQQHGCGRGGRFLFSGPLVPLDRCTWMERGLVLNTYRTRSQIKETPMSNFDQQMHKMKAQPGFVAALDQSGGSTPHALSLYGIKDDRWSNEQQMLTSCIRCARGSSPRPASPASKFLRNLSENTMDREIENQSTADYLWNVKRIVPFLKVDRGLEREARACS